MSTGSDQLIKANKILIMPKSAFNPASGKCWAFNLRKMLRLHLGPPDQLFHGKHSSVETPVLTVCHLPDQQYTSQISVGFFRMQPAIDAQPRILCAVVALRASSSTLPCRKSA